MKILSKGTGDILSIKELIFFDRYWSIFNRFRDKNLNKNNESLRKDYVKCKWRIWPHSKFNGKCSIFKQKHTRYWSTDVLTLCKRKIEKGKKRIQFSFSSLELSWPQTACEPTGQFSYSGLQWQHSCTPICLATKSTWTESDAQHHNFKTQSNGSYFHCQN